MWKGKETSGLGLNVPTIFLLDLLIHLKTVQKSRLTGVLIIIALLAGIRIHCFQGSFFPNKCLSWKKENPINQLG